MPLFFRFDPFLRLGQKSLQRKVHFLGDLKTPKFPSEMNWPLGIVGLEFQKSFMLNLFSILNECQRKIVFTTLITQIWEHQNFLLRLTDL